MTYNILDDGSHEYLSLVALGNVWDFAWFCQ